MGGHALVDAAAKSGAFARLLLLDPTIAAPESYASPPPESEQTGTHPGAKRKRTFASPEEMMGRLSSKGAYPLFEPRILHDYCKYGLERLDSGQYQLLCPPEIEASVYVTARTNGGVHDSVRALEIPVTIMRAQLPPAERAQMDFASSPTWPDLAGEFKQGRDLHYPDCSHFIPMQIPDEVVRILREEIDAWHASC
jgi:pimeloyl-ACP methyl ester carboxylesterase